MRERETGATVRPMRATTALAAISLATLSGCSDATGSLVGGDPVALTMALPPAMSDAGDDGAAAPTTLLTSADCLPGGAHAGNTWTDLYTCYFGSTGTDSCSGQGTSCHATDTSAGGMFAWVCGTDPATCYNGMKGYAPLDPQAGMSAPTMNGLYTVLCGHPGGAMPLGCPTGTSLLSGDFTRIAAWIQAGAPNN
jgi:hypothetical protein